MLSLFLTQALLAMWAAEAASAEIVRSVPSSQRVQIKTDDISIVVQTGTRANIEIRYIAPVDVDPEGSLNVREHRSQLRIQANKRSSSWFERGGDRDEEAQLLILLPPQGVKSLELVSKTGTIQAQDLPSSIQSLEIDTVTSVAEVRTKSSRVDYRSVTGKAAIELMGKAQRLKASDVNGRLSVTHRFESPGIDISTRGQISMAGVDSPRRQRNGLRVFHQEGSDESALIEYSSVAGSILLQPGLQ